VHVEFARKWAETNDLGLPHFLYQSLVIVAAKLFFPGGEQLDYLAAGRLVSTSVYVALFVLQFLMIRLVIGRGGLRFSLLAALMAWALMIVAPINILYSVDQHSYFGYLPQETYNVPSHPLMKTLALPLFFLAEAIFLRVSSTGRYPLVGAAALLSVLVALAKPSFTVILLPSAGLLVGYKVVRRAYINWNLLLFGFLVPSIIVLGWQYFVSYATQWGSLSRPYQATRIGFVPFAQFTRWDVPLSLLLPKLILSIFFPLVVYATHWKLATRDFRFNFAWLIFLFGCLSTYLFAEIYVETGEVASAGNFTWSGLAGVFILFIAAGIFLVRRTIEPQPGTKREWLPLGASFLALALHVIFGVIWYFDQFRLFTEIRY
jgi:hypothetical protein